MADHLQSRIVAPEIDVAQGVAAGFFISGCASLVPACQLPTINAERFWRTSACLLLGHSTAALSALAASPNALQAVLLTGGGLGATGAVLKLLQLPRRQHLYARLAAEHMPPAKLAAWFMACASVLHAAYNVNRPGELASEMRAWRLPALAPAYCSFISARRRRLSAQRRAETAAHLQRSSNQPRACRARASSGRHPRSRPAPAGPVASAFEGGGCCAPAAPRAPGSGV